MSENLDFSPEALEASIQDMQQVDEFNNGVDYDKFIVLTKKDLSNFCRIVEPLTKQAIDMTGKSVLIKCIDESTVELRYLNTPFVVAATIPNKSGKTVSPFVVTVNTLKRLVTQAFASLILVEQDGEMNIALCESLLYLETKPFDETYYQIDKKETPGLIDKESAIYTFKKIGASLSLTDRAQEKTIVVKNGKTQFNTGLFAANTNSPFSGSENFVIYQAVANIIALFAELSTTGVAYQVEDETLILSTGVYYAEVQIGSEEKVAQFSSPTTEAALGFDATVQVVNDNLLRIITVVGGLEYLCDIISMNFTDEYLELIITNESQTKKSSYKFNITSGKPTIKGEMKSTVEVLKLFLNIVGQDAKFDLNESGLGIETPAGKFLLRKS